MKTAERIHSLDFLRGIALIFIILFHTSVYNFAKINKIDFSNPPILIVLISFLILWGGLIILYSGFVNTLMLVGRHDEKPEFRPFGILIIAGLIYVVIHYLLILVLGRWSVDFVNNRPELTAVASTIRSGSISFPSPDKLFDGTSLSTIAFNLILLTLINFALLRNGGIAREARNYSILLAGGSLIMIFSFVRIGLYPIFQSAIAEGHTGLALAEGFLLANPYPLIPYFSYGLFGSAAALLFYRNRKDLIAKVLIPIGVLFLVYGIAGAMRHDKTISTPDWFWYFKTQFELGIFLLLLSVFLLTFRKGRKIKPEYPLVLWFSRLSLTIYLLETLVSELLGKAGLLIFPGWNQTINGCLLFGAVNVAIWAMILFFWRKADFRYSLEYFWVKLFSRMDKESGKLGELE
jgi:surface polysaccharide O-acyltransferase-like enzyme